MKVKSYAKVNLLLKVIEKRSDGYHNLQMLNKRINLFDVISIEKNDTFEVTFKNIDVDPSFIYKVIKRLCKKYDIKNKYKIEIIKHIPLGAGLGGASMNAATIIDTILSIEGINSSLEDKINNFKDLGADIPYGFINECAIVEGIGDSIYIIEKQLPSNLVLVNANIFLSTKEVFEKNTVYSKKYTHSEIINKDIYINDLEEAAFLVCPKLKDLKQNLTRYGKVVMSGAGSSFIVHTNEYKKIKEEFKDCLVINLE